MVSLNSQPQIQTNQWFDTTHVVAIGINNYNKGVRSLGKAVNDAVKVAGIIENLKPTEKVKYYFSLALKSNFSNEVEQEVTRLGGNRQPYLPTREGFRELLSHLRGTVNKNDRIILYFAGHGIALPFSQVTKDDRNSTSSPSQMKLDDKPQGYLLFQDAVKGDRNTYMKMDELIGALHEIQCRHGLIILDCCFAGAIEWSLYRGITRQIGDDLVTPSILDRYITKNAWQILTSSSENQVTNEVLNREYEQLEIDHRGSGENSPFVIALRKAIIDGEADLIQPKRGFIHTTRLIDYLREEVESKSIESNKLQTPCIFPFPLKHEQTAEFVFLLGGKKLEEIKSDLPKDPEIDEKDNPYLGLLSYSTDDSNIFFGRKRLINQLFDCVKQNKFPLTIVLGASGSGKSSLVKAGLISKMFPKLENSQDIHKGWVEFRPGLSPGDSLEKARKDIQIDSIPQGEKRLLVIDQFEEVETQCKDKEQKNKFWKELIKLITENAEKIDVVLTLRSDFETTLRSQFESAFRDNSQLQTETYNYWVDARFTVPTMEREELEEAIEKPASTRVVFFEEKNDNGERTLVKQLSHEVAGMPGALPLLSVALQSMYKNFAKRYLESVRNGEPVKREISWEDYESLGGGVVGSLTKRANQLYEELVQDDAYRHTVRNIMLRMISLQGNGLTRRQVPISELKYRDQKENERVETVIKQFSEARLIVEGSNPPDEAYVEPAHDALVQGWDKFQEWIKKDVEDLILQQSLNAQVSDWKNKEKPETRLWRDDDRLPRLKQLLENQAKNWLNEQETDFVEQSIKQKRKQEDELTQNRINELTPSANSRFRDHEQLEALTYILKAGKLLQKLIREDSPYLSPETRLNTQLVLREILSKVEEKNRFMFESRSIHAIDFSRDGQIIATADGSGIVKLFDPEGKQINPRQMNGNMLMKIFDVSGGERITLRGGSKYLYLLNPDGTLRLLNSYLSPDGGCFAQRGQEREGKVTLYSRDGAKLKTLTGLDEETFMTVAFSPDSQVIASGGWKGWLYLWNRDGELITQQNAGGGSLNTINFSPNGEMLVTGSNDGKVRLWKPDGTHLRTDLHEFQAHSDAIWGLCFSSNGEMFATGSSDRTVKLWKPDGTEVKTLEGHKGVVHAVAFNPNDNQNLASASDNGSVKIWNLGGTGLKILARHEDSVYTVRFSPDSKTILTTSGHGKVSFWRTDGTLKQPSRSWHNGSISTLDFSPNGEMIVTASGDKEVRLYNSDGDLIKYIKQKKERDKSEWDEIEVSGVSFSPNSQVIALADQQGSVKIYNIGDGTFTTLRNAGYQAWAVKFSPNGNILASAHSEGVVALWQLDGTLLGTLPGGYLNCVWGIDFSPNGDLIASSHIDGTVKLWNLNGSSDQPLILGEPSSNVDNRRIFIPVRFSPNGDMIASAHADGTVKLWNLDGSLHKILEGHKSRVNAVDFSPNGKTLASASEDQTVILWDLERSQDLDGLLQRGCKWAEGYLTNNPNITDEDRQIILNINKNP